MMKDWKARQAAFHHANKKHKDDLKDEDILYSEDIVDDVLMHFAQYVPDWIYPAKSYVVAICYAKWLEQDFGEDFYEVLDDPELLFGNDPYFVPYSEDENIYDAILKELDFNEDLGMVPDIYEYYREEMFFGT
jgi:hypothetical protein